MNCPDQDLCREIIINLAPIQMGDVEPIDFSGAAKEEMQALWNAGETAFMQAELRML